MSIRGISSINPAKIVMDMKLSKRPVTVCMTFEYLDQCHDIDAQITLKGNKWKSQSS